MRAKTASATQNVYKKMVIDGRNVGLIIVATSEAVGSWIIDEELIESLETLGKFVISDRKNPERYPPRLFKRDPRSRRSVVVSLQRAVVVLKKSKDRVTLASNFSDFLDEASKTIVRHTCLSQDSQNCLSENWESTNPDYDIEEVEERMKLKKIVETKTDDETKIQYGKALTYREFNRVRTQSKENKKPAATKEEYEKIMKDLGFEPVFDDDDFSYIKSK